MEIWRLLSLLQLSVRIVASRTIFTFYLPENAKIYILGTWKMGLCQKSEKWKVLLSLNHNQKPNQTINQINCPSKVAGNTGFYSDVSTYNQLRKHNTQKQKWWLFYLALPLWVWPQTNCIWGKQGETAANLIVNLEAVAKGQCSGRQKVEKSLKEIGEEEGRALLALTRYMSQSELSTGWDKVLGNVLKQAWWKT